MPKWRTMIHKIQKVKFGTFNLKFAMFYFDILSS